MAGDALQTTGDLLQRGGWVMWPLLALSLVAVALSVERLIFWALTHRPGRRRWLAAVADRLRAGDHPGARALIAKDGSVYARAAASLLDRPAGAGDAAAVEVIEALRPEIERFSIALSTIITAAPLLGILGTVLGIIDSFGVLGAGAGGPVTDPALVADGIAMALITTAFGLVISAFTLFPHAMARASASRCLSRLEALAAAAEQGRAAA